jgi:chloramphenicol-sensitive protein RarD
MTTLGLLQYVSPSLVFLLSIVVFKESMQWPRLVGFAMIWGALLVYSVEGLFNSRRARLAQTSQAA